jgi:antitoxin VapB
MDRKTQRAKLFKHGGSQAVRLPKSFRFEGLREVEVSRNGSEVILRPVALGWSERFVKLAGSCPDFPYPAEPPPPDEGPDLG